MLRMSQHLARRTFLDDPSGIHHGDAACDLSDDAKVVCDEKERNPELSAQCFEQIENLLLHRDVERRRWLIRDENAWPCRERHGDHRALSKASR